MKSRFRYKVKVFCALSVIFSIFVSTKIACVTFINSHLYKKQFKLLKRIGATLDENWQNIDTKIDNIETKIDASNIELGSIESKLDDWVGPLNETIDSKLDIANIELGSIESKLDDWVGPLAETIDSKVDTLLSYKGTTIPSCPGTITTSGTYSLAANQTCCITIDADDVTLNFGGFTLYCDSGNAVIEILPGHKNIEIINGKIKSNGTTVDGILTGSDNQFITVENVKIYSCDTGIYFNATASDAIKSCRVKDCSIQGCNKGVYAECLIKTVFSSCEAFNCVEAGFELQYSDFNVFDKCKALETQNDDIDGDAIGFKSFAGCGNLFTECVAEGTTKTTSNSGTEATGFLFTGTDTQMETESKIVNCIANSSSILSGTGSAYGIHFEQIALSGDDFMGLIDSEALGNTVYGVDWAPDGRYLATGGAAGTGSFEIRAYSFDGSSLSLIDSTTHGNTVYSVDWSPDGRYLAVGGGASGGIEIRVYSFDGSSLTFVDSDDTPGSSVYSVKWSPDGRYLAVVYGLIIKIYGFDGSSLTPIVLVNSGLGSPLRSVDWSPDGNYLAAAASNTTGDQIGVYSFDGSSLTVVDTAVQFYSRSVDWSQDGRYLAVGGNRAFGAVIKVYSFDGSSLTFINSVDGSSVLSVSWSPDGKYLAGSATTGIITVYSFDGGTLTFMDTAAHGNTVNSVNWSSDGRYLAMGGETASTYQIRVYAMMNAPTSCILRGNFAGSSGGDLTIGYGIAGGGDNLFVANTGYANDANFSYGVMPFVAGELSNPSVIDNLWML